MKRALLLGATLAALACAPLQAAGEETVFLQVTIPVETAEVCEIQAPALALLLAGTNDTPVIIECSVLTIETAPIEEDNLDGAADVIADEGAGVSPLGVTDSVRELLEPEQLDGEGIESPPETEPSLPVDEPENGDL